MPQMSLTYGIAALIVSLALVGCSDPSTNNIVDPETGKHYIADWPNPDVHGAWAKKPGSEAGFASCQECHGADFAGGNSRQTCLNTAGCHGAGVQSPHPAIWAASAARTHQTTDASNAPVCAGCHADGANSPIALVAPAPAGTAPGCFNNTLCHGEGHPAGWKLPAQHGTSAKAQASGFSGCKTCHGSNFNGAGSAPTCLNTASCHGATVNAPHSPKPWRTSAGSARTHTDTNTGNAAVCADCHTLGANLTTVPVPTNLVPGTPACFNSTLCHGQVGHAVGWVVPGAHGVAAKSAPSATNMTGFSSCQTCHAANFTGGTSTISCLNTAGCHGLTVSSPHARAPWVASVTSTMTHTTTNVANATVCGYCHEGESSNGNHAYATPTGPVGCFDSTLCHGSATALGCVNCHNAVISSPIAQSIDASVTQRRAIVPEFKNTWSHKRSAAVSGTVTNQDCAVCHMEGNVSDGSRNLAYHGNGYIELRDPDTGSTIKQAMWNNSPAGSGSYASGATDARFVRFSRNLATVLVSDANYAILGGIMINQCLHCHDANGATNASAWVTNGSALKPFATTITGHLAPYNSNGNGNVVNVAGSFDPTNATYHPVMGKQNNSYTQGTRMVAPWNLAKTNGNNTQYGNLLSCWDCHAPSGISSSATLTMTVTAHGAPATLRAPVRAGGNTAVANLCLNCHATVYATTNTNHGLGSAFGSGGDSAMGTTIFPNCHNCHSYNGAVGATVSAAGTRPNRAEDVHGFNDRTPGTVGSKWPSGSRPYAFIRNTLSNWAPASATGDTITGAHTCSGTGGTCNNNMNNSSYTPGGVY
jgi:hypothetical protein